MLCACRRRGLGFVMKITSERNSAERPEASGGAGQESTLSNQVRTINLALQGGGAHGAFTWGVLDRFLARLRLRPTRRVYCYHIAEDLARSTTLVNDGQIQARLCRACTNAPYVGIATPRQSTVSAECCRAIESRQTRQQVAEGLVHTSTLVHATATSPLACLRVGLIL